jgi:hypothetical protein
MIALKLRRFRAELFEGGFKVFDDFSGRVSTSGQETTKHQQTASKAVAVSDGYRRMSLREAAGRD